MITVMFPSGVRISYNDANDVKFEMDRIEICSKDNMGQRYYRAAIPLQAGCLIEWKEPCKITAPPMATVASALQLVLEVLNRRGTITGWDEERQLAELKTKLRRFDARRKTWKP